MLEHQSCCACKRVKHGTVPAGSGAVRDHWTCETCGAEFVRKPVPEPCKHNWIPYDAIPGVHIQVCHGCGVLGDPHAPAPPREEPRVRVTYTDPDGREIPMPLAEALGILEQIGKEQPAPPEPEECEHEWRRVASVFGKYGGMCRCLLCGSTGYPPKKPEPRCADCRFKHHDTCRRMPPQRSEGRPDHSSKGVWPGVAYNDWCGEFSAKEPSR